MKTVLGWVVAFLFGVAVSLAAFSTCPVVKKWVNASSCPCVNKCCDKKGCCPTDGKKVCACTCEGACNCCGGCCKK